MGFGIPTRSSSDAETARLSEPSQRDEEEGDATGAVPGGDECGGAMGSPAGVDCAALPEDRTEGWAPTDAAGGDAAGLFPSKLVCSDRPDGERDDV